NLLPHAEQVTGDLVQQLGGLPGGGGLPPVDSPLHPVRGTPLTLLVVDLRLAVAEQIEDRLRMAAPIFTVSAAHALDLLEDVIGGLEEVSETGWARQKRRDPLRADNDVEQEAGEMLDWPRTPAPVGDRLLGGGIR